MKQIKLSRNDPCWCGSGKKYKKCHWENDQNKEIIHNERYSPPSGVTIKTPEDIEGIRKSCQLAKRTLDLVTTIIKHGITTDDINSVAHDFIIKNGAIPAPLNYNGFPKSVCTSINNVICHGIPDATKLKDSDIINVDVTTLLDGYHGDCGRMYIVGDASPEAIRLVNIAEECLYIGINQVKPYADFGEIGYAIEQHALKHGFSVVRDYGGHGIGKKFHEEPHVHHYGHRKRGMIMLPNMVFTIEPMINQGRHETKLLSDKWTAVTIDGKLSAQWEHTIQVTENGFTILSQ